MRKRTPGGPYRRPVPRVQGGAEGGRHYFMSDVPLQVLNAPNVGGHLALARKDAAGPVQGWCYNVTCNADGGSESAIMLVW